jgi:transposase
VRAERERARFRLHLVRHRTALKNRIHATLLAFGKPCPVSDLLWRRRPPAAGRPGTARAVDRQPHRGLALIDDLDDQIDACEQQLRHLGADHP